MPRQLRAGASGRRAPSGATPTPGGRAARQGSRRIEIDVAIARGLLPSPPMLVASSSFARLCRARARLVEDAAASWSIAEVARSSGMSPFHFSRSFGAVFGVSPHQARIAARLDRAKELLARGQLSVTEVCLEVGFESLGSFSTLFARRVGESPSRYRRRVRAQVTVPGALPAQAFPGCLTLMGLLPADAFRRFREVAAG
jgi:AraC-like DNA-binding protein